MGTPVCRLPGNPPKSPLPGGHCAPRGHRAKHTRSFASPYCLPALLHYDSSIKSSVGILFTGWRALCRSLSHATRYTMSCELGLPSVCATFQLQIPLHAEEGAVQLPATFGNNISLSVCSVEATATNQKTPLRPRGRCTVQVHVHSIRCQSILVRYVCSSSPDWRRLLPRLHKGSTPLPAFLRRHDAILNTTAMAASGYLQGSRSRPVRHDAPPWTDAWCF